MENNQQLQQQPQKTGIQAASEKVTGIAETIEKLYPIYSERVRKAVAHSKTLPVEIKSDEDDKKIEAALVAYRATFKTVEDERKQCTSILDEAKEFLMIPEKYISTDKAENGSIFNKFKSLRDAYANKKLLEEKQKKDKAEADRIQGLEINRIRSEFNLSVVNGQAAILSQTTAALTKWLNDATLEKWEDLETSINGLDPILKPEIWAGWFTVGYNTAIVTSEVYNGLCLEAKALHTYEKCSIDFKAAALLVRDNIAAQLPEKNTNLIALAELEKTNAAQAEELRKKQQDEEKEKSDALQAIQQKATETATETIKQQEQDANMNTEFHSQKATQQIETVSGVRVSKKGLLVCPEDEICVVVAELFFRCFTNLKWKGIYELDRSKNKKLDETGMPILRDWLQEMLNFVATNEETMPDGVEAVDVVGTVQKAVK